MEEQKSFSHVREEHNQYDMFNNLVSYANESGFNPSVVKLGRCYVDNAHFNTIYPNGTVDICDSEGSDNIGRGELTEDGSIYWKQKLPCFEYSIKKENIMCVKCKYMPMCGGPCPAKRIQTYLTSKDTNTAICPFENMNLAIERDIKNLYRTFK